VESLHAEIAALRAALAQREQQLSERESQLAEKARALAVAEHNIDVLKRMIFGSRSEKRGDGAPVDPAQGVLALGDLAAQTERDAQAVGSQGQVAVTSPGRERRRTGRRSRFPAHLPTVRSTFRLADSARACACGGRLEEMGEEVTRELERVEISVVHEIARVKYACPRCKEHVATAPGPSRVIEKGLLGVGFLAHVVAERFAHHMPYHRLEKKYEAEGLSLSRSVLCASAARCADLLEPVRRRMLQDVLAAPIVGTDDTNVIIQEGSSGGSRRGHLWLYRDLEGTNVFDFTESRSRDGPARILKDFRGYLQADAASIYDAFFLPGGAVEVGCWAHARRKFVQAETTEPALAAEAIRRIALLYAVEKGAKDRAPEDRRALRESRSRPVLEDIFDWMGRTRPTVLDRSPMAEALDYALKNRVALMRYLEDGRLPIDNNGVERALRCVAVGRKNWIFVGNEEGGRRAATLYSLVQTCREIGVDPKEYLRDVLLRISTCSDVTKLTPRGWKTHFADQVAAERRGAIERILLGNS
jgi:transposase